MEKVEIKNKITSDYIIELYEKAKNIKDPKKKSKAMKNIKIMSEHLGEYLVKKIKK